MGERKEQGQPWFGPTWGRCSNNKSKGSSNSLSTTHGRAALGSSKGGSDSGGYSSGSGGSGGYSSGDGGSGGERRNSGGRARVGPVGRGMRGAVHPGSKVVPSMRLYHGWPKEREERMG